MSDEITYEFVLEDAFDTAARNGYVIYSTGIERDLRHYSGAYEAASAIIQFNQPSKKFDFLEKAKANRLATLIENSTARNR